MNNSSKSPEISWPEWWSPVIPFEAGDMQKEAVLLWFAQLVMTGDIWRLPPGYISDAATLIERGHIHFESDKSKLDS